LDIGLRVIAWEVQVHPCAFPRGGRDPQPRPDGDERREELLYEGGLEAFVRWLDRAKKPLIRAPISIRGEREAGGQRWFNTLQDITAQKAAEEKIRRLNRVYAVLSGINSLIVRVRREGELFQAACDLVVRDGNFRMAWIGLVEGMLQVHDRFLVMDIPSREDWGDPHTCWRIRPRRR
jgi:PAS domain-containing protein